MGSVMRQSNLRASLICLLLIVALSGCTMLGKQIGQPLPIEQTGLEENITHVRQIVLMLGPPTHMSALPHGFIMVYEYIDVAEQQLGINLELLGLDWFKMSFGHAAAQHQSLVLVFDDAGVLQVQEYDHWTDDLGKGFGFQLFFVALPTVDTGHVVANPEQLNWGRSFLQALPVTLNTAQSLDSGSHGMELRGTPNSVGQRTLEMGTMPRRKRSKDQQ